MMFHQKKDQDFSIYKARRKELVQAVKQAHVTDDQGLIMLIAGFENDRYAFWQESSFFYYTGLTEPGAVLVMDFSGKTDLYIPNCGDVRKKWMHSPVAVTQENAKHLGVEQVMVLGDQCSGYQLFPFFKQQSYGHVIARLQQLVAQNANLFTLYPENEHEYVEQRLVINNLQKFVPGLSDCVVDVSSFVADMRRQKSTHEIDFITAAIDITVLAQAAAAQAIGPDALECEVQASLEYIMTGSSTRLAFPSIVATGKNATILHYTANTSAMKKGDLVVVDIGAAFDGYCADLTRTYPVSGKFSKRQRELYNLVLDAQTYIADLAKPGMYLNNSDEPERSLHHLAQSFLKKHGYDQYFVHGIGHFLGLDVHDVGNVKEPLKENDVFTIEPGIYIPQEGIGIRIEDDFWMAKKGAICLSEDLPKDPVMIEQMAQETLQDQIDDFEELELDEDVTDEMLENLEH